jgi:hypothetical protein
MFAFCMVCAMRAAGYQYSAYIVRTKSTFHAYIVCFLFDHHYMYIETEFLFVHNIQIYSYKTQKALLLQNGTSEH